MVESVAGRYCEDRPDEQSQLTGLVEHIIHIPPHQSDPAHPRVVPSSYSPTTWPYARLRNGPTKKPHKIGYRGIVFRQQDRGPVYAFGMDKVPFSVYDFLAYLAAGSAVLIAIDYANGSPILRSKDISAVMAVVLVLAAYVVGQMVAHISAWLYENGLVRRVLSSPTEHLMRDGVNSGVTTRIFPGYFRRLPSSVQAKVRDQTAARGCSAVGDGLFMHCYAISTATLDKLQGRLDEFRTQYGFARNMSCALLASALIIVIYRLAGRQIHLRWSLVSLVCATIMLYRYLKFYRQYSYELLLRYAELPLPKG